MKEKIKLMIIALVVLASGVEGIVFIPPVVYVVTLSVGAFIVNIFLFAAAWLALMGLVDRMYFGRKLHELVRVLLQAAGKATILVTSAVIPVLGLKPITPLETIASSIVSGAIGLSVLFLAAYREYRLKERKQKIGVLRSIAVFSLFIILAAYLSTTLAQETKIIDTRTGYEAREDYKAFALRDMKEAADLEKPTKEVYWFYPVNSSPCSIYSGGVHLLTVQPAENCYYLEDNNPRRIFCPIPFEGTGIMDKTEGGVLEGRGSCTQRLPPRDGG